MSTMQLRQLGHSTLEIFPWSFGTNIFGRAIDEPTAFAVLDAYVEAGGNCIDTADVYNTGESEAVLGRWINGKCPTKSILHTFGESRPASTQNSLARPSRPLKRGNRTVKTEVLKRGKYLWKDGGEVDRGKITLGSARRVGSSGW